MKKNKYGLNTICTRIGEVEDKQFKGAVSPIYLSTSYAFLDVEVKRYPRYFNTPNQAHLAQKIAALEHTESALIFSSGMAAISHMFFSFLKKGDHLVVQNTLYGGAAHFIKEEFPKHGINFTFTEGYEVKDFEKAINNNTKLIHIESPSNPLLTITNLKAIAQLAKSKDIKTSIDNTFASPVNQNPAKYGIDLIMHSATKYLGGHSDICAGTVAGSKKDIDCIWSVSKNLGGSLSDFTVWMLERSMKTLGLRVKAQTKNAYKIANWLEKHKAVKKVYYPGLASHKEHLLAKSQMKGFGAMLSFELKEQLDAMAFQKHLKLIKPSMSLAGIESTITSPALTSHALLTEEERRSVGISPQLVRLSVGIESIQDIKDDIAQALNKSYT